MRKDHILQPLDILYSLFFGVLLTGAFNISLIAGYLFGSEQEAFVDLYQEAIINGQDIFFFFEDNRGVIATLTTVLLWAFVYIVGYSILHFIYKEVKSTKEELKVHATYIHPKNISKTTFWGSSLLVIAYPVVVVVLSLLWAVISYSVLIPFASIWLIIALYGGNSIFGASMIILLVVGVMSLIVLGFIVIFKLLKTVSKFIIG